MRAPQAGMWPSATSWATTTRASAPDSPSDRVKRAAVLFAALALSLIGAVAPVDGAVVGGTGGGGAPLPALQATPIASGLNFPVQMAMAPDRRIFFNERLTGKIRVLQRGAGSPPAYSLRSRPFYKLPVSTSGEQGLLGLAVDPEFPS